MRHVTYLLQWWYAAGEWWMMMNELRVNDACADWYQLEFPESSSCWKRRNADSFHWRRHQHRFLQFGEWSSSLVNICWKMLLGTIHWSWIMHLAEEAAATTPSFRCPLNKQSFCQLSRLCVHKKEAVSSTSISVSIKTQFGIEYPDWLRFRCLDVGYLAACKHISGLCGTRQQAKWILWHRGSKCLNSGLRITLNFYRDSAQLVFYAFGGCGFSSRNWFDVLTTAASEWIG